MPSITVAVPEDLKRAMDALDTINWSAVARESIRKEVERQQLLRRFTEESDFTEEDALRLGRELKRRAAKQKE